MPKLIFRLVNNFSSTGKYSLTTLFSQRKLLYQSTAKLLQQHNFKQKIYEQNPNIDQDALSIYCGYDPTAPSLHLGNLVSIIMMARIQHQLGIRPIFLLGGATGQIGDPSGKKKQRSLLQRSHIKDNLMKIQLQIRNVYENLYNNFRDESGEYGYLLTNRSSQAFYINNQSFYDGMQVIDFLRDIGKHMSMSSLLGKQHIASRLESQSGISYTEFTYTLLQAYDFYMLSQKYNCCLQFGGSDQWGNIVNGCSLIRKITNSQNQGYGLTMPLLLTKGGQKFGKSEGNALFLDKGMTTTSKIYDYLYNTADQQIEKLLYIFTFYSPQRISGIMHQHNANKEKRIAQKLLAEKVTGYLGSYKNVKEQILKFTTNQIKNLSVQQLEQFYEQMPSQMKSQQQFGLSGVRDLPDLLFKHKIVTTKKQGRREIEGEGIYLNNAKIPKGYQYTEIATALEGELLKQKYLLVRKGKKKCHMIKFV